MDPDTTVYHYPMKTDPCIPLVAYDGDGNRVLVRVDPERIQYVITALQPTRDDFERDAARRQEVFGGRP